jgi:hypothetical protein
VSHRELAGVGAAIAGDATEVQRLSSQVGLTLGGPVVESWGGVPMPVVARRPPAGRGDTVQGPRWFQAMDRNGDGVVSPREFVGPPEVFAKLDADGDRVISAEDVARAIPVGPKGGR